MGMLIVCGVPVSSTAVTIISPTAVMLAVLTTDITYCLRSVMVCSRSSLGTTVCDAIVSGCTVATRAQCVLELGWMGGRRTRTALCADEVLILASMLVQCRRRGRRCC